MTEHVADYETRDISSEFTFMSGISNLIAHRVGNIVFLSFRYTPSAVGSWEEGIVTIPERHLPITSVLPITMVSLTTNGIGKAVSGYIYQKNKVYFQAKDANTGLVICSVTYVTEEDQ